MGRLLKGQDVGNDRPRRQSDDASKMCCPADKILVLKKDFDLPELAHQLQVPYDLLQAANGRNGIFPTGDTVSLGEERGHSFAVQR